MFNGGAVAGRPFYEGLIKRGYKEFNQVSDAIRAGRFSKDLFEEGFYCHQSVVDMLVESSKGTKLEAIAKRLLEARKIEQEMIEKLESASPDEKHLRQRHQEDVEKGLSTWEIFKRDRTRAYVLSCIAQSNRSWPYNLMAY
jgi:hypothetical protein